MKPFKDPAWPYGFPTPTLYTPAPAPVYPHPPAQPSAPEPNPTYQAYMAFAAAALEGTLRQSDSIIASKEEVVEKAWDLANAMMKRYIDAGGQ